MQQHQIIAWSVACVMLVGVILAAYRVRRRPKAPAALGPPAVVADPIKIPWTDREASEYWEPTAPDPRGRRKAFRRRGNPVLVQITSTPDLPRQGWVVNRSAEGIALAVDRPVAVGLVIPVLPSHAPTGTPPVDVTVKWCLERADYHELGCKFAHPLTPGLLLLFG